jgi:nucleoside-diphosphate-sugar epimerase
MKKILVTGGAGYVGTTLVPMLLEKGHDVTVIDNLMFMNGDRMIPFINNKKFHFVKGDVRDLKLMKGLVEGKDVVIHLAAYVGFPICRLKGQKESYSLNTEATDKLVKMMTDEQYLLFGSTGSNYGEVIGLCTEETPLNPLSIYGKTKTEAEQIVMSRVNSTAFRFATAFGISPRMRLDLLVNDLTYKAITEGYAVIYESHFLRTFIHIRDLARSFVFAIENQEKMVGEVYNVGSNTMNYTKREVCEMINEEIPEAFFHHASIKEDPDKRNYQVSYDKINSLGFEVEVDLKTGIREIKDSVQLLEHSLRYRNV